MSATDLAAPGVAAALRVGVHGLSKSFKGGVDAVVDLDLSIAAGDFVALLGPSGCGKSTLLRMIAGLETADRGQVELTSAEGGSRGDVRRSVAYVFQDPHLMPWRRVLGNVTLPLELRGVGRATRRQAALVALERVGLADAAMRFPGQLSGGMRMRVSLARALVTDPALLLLDEPFAALDELTRQRLDEQLYELWRSRGMTVVFVTHSIAEAAYLARRAVVFTRRPARIVRDGAVELPLDRPASLRGTAAFAAQTAWMLEALQRGEAS